MSNSMTSDDKIRYDAMSPWPCQIQDNILVTFISKPLTLAPDSKVHGANMGPIWGQQDPGGPHVGPMNFAIWGINGWHSKDFKAKIFSVKFVQLGKHFTVTRIVSRNKVRTLNKN